MVGIPPTRNYCDGWWFRFLIPSLPGKRLHSLRQCGWQLEIWHEKPARRKTIPWKTRWKVYQNYMPWPKSFNERPVLRCFDLWLPNTVPFSLGRNCGLSPCSAAVWERVMQRPRSCWLVTPEKLTRMAPEVCHLCINIYNHIYIYTCDR
jgi:hypothetical protein